MLVSHRDQREKEASCRVSRQLFRDHWWIGIKFCKARVIDAYETNGGRHRRQPDRRWLEELMVEESEITGQGGDRIGILVWVLQGEDEDVRQTLRERRRHSPNRRWLEDVSGGNGYYKEGERRVLGIWFELWEGRKA